MNVQLKQELTSLIGSPVKWDCPLRDYTSFRIGGPARALVTVENIDELQDLIRFLEKYELPFRAIGRGTNLLVSDQGFQGVAILLAGEFKEITILEQEDVVIVTAGAGYSLNRLAKVCVEKGISGLEFVFGIPGTVGGAAIMNAGAWGSEMADVILSITIIGQRGCLQYNRSELDFSYRKLRLPALSQSIVTSVTFKLKKGEAEDIRRRCDHYREQRLLRQPVGEANAGSTFKNPQGESAGRLIEASGLKGKGVGDAAVSEKHANFIINRGGATAAEVLELIQYIQRKVKEDSGVHLEPEVHIL